MKAIVTALLCILLPVVAFAQSPNVVSTSPANNAVNVSTSTTTVSLTFDAAIDTTTFMLTGEGGPSGGLLTNVDTLSALTFSSSHLTVNLSVKLSAGKSYFVLLFYAKRAGGSALASPYIFRFTTAASFPSTSVSGTVSGGTTGISPAGTAVVLNTGPITGSINFIAGAVADGAGAFTIPYVPNGTLYPVAAKDVNGDGQIDPTMGDPIAFPAPIVVSGTNISGLTLTLRTDFQRRYAEVIDTLNAYAASLPSPRVLREIEASRIDSTGASGEWKFSYTGANRAGSFIFRVEAFGARQEPMDSGTYVRLGQWSPIPSVPAKAVVDSFLARAERNGGKAYRPSPMNWNNFDVRLTIGDLYWGEFRSLVSDSSKNYLGLNYWYGIYGQNSSTTFKQRIFLGDYTTGTILGTTGVDEGPAGRVPRSFSLEQNYPNPFNPSTMIRYSLPVKSNVTLTVYNALGQQVASLVNEYKEAGVHDVRFDAAGLATGVYFYRLAAGNFVETRKLLLVK